MWMDAVQVLILSVEVRIDVQIGGASILEHAPRAILSSACRPLLNGGIDLLRIFSRHSQSVITLH